MGRSFGILAAGCLAILAVWGGCSSSDGESGTADCSVAGENAQIFSTMQSWYYWYGSLPASVDPASYDRPSALLDAIRQQPLDRFSYIITRAANQSFYEAGQYVGYGLGFVITDANYLQVTRVFPGSPAAQGGLIRGDTVTDVNGTPVPTLIGNNELENALTADSPGVDITFAYMDLQLQRHTVTMSSAVVTEPSVAQVDLLAVGSEKVGYIVFNSFITPSNDELDQAFGQLLSQGATQLVIDERYNGGGEVAVAQHLASLIAGKSYAGRVLGALTYNDRHTNRNQTIAFQRLDGALNLGEVYFITSESTASASEFIINALVPYINVVTVGGTTFGKPVGEDGFDICADVLYPITFKIANASGYGDYFDGLPPTCAAIDDLTHVLGDPNEASLAAALDYVSTGTCGQGARAARGHALREARRPREASRYGWRQLVNGY